MENKLPSNKSFGLVFFVFFSIVFLISKNNYTLFFALIFLMLGILNSSLLTPLNKIWMKFGYFLGKVISPIVMLIIYVLIICSTKLIIKFIGKDLLNLKYNHKKKTYWKSAEKKSVDMNIQF